MLTDANGVERPMQNAEALAAKQELFGGPAKLRGEVPDSALDQIVNKYGATTSPK